MTLADPDVTLQTLDICNEVAGTVPFEHSSYLDCKTAFVYQSVTVACDCDALTVTCNHHCSDMGVFVFLMSRNAISEFFFLFFQIMF